MKAWLGAFLLWVPAIAQDKPPSPFSKNGAKKEEPDPSNPHRSLSYYKHYEKSMEYLLAHYGDVKWPLAPALFAGLAFFLDGREELKPHMEAVLKRAIAGCELNGLYNRNWFVTYSAFLLSIVYLKDPRPEIKAALEQAVKSIEQSQEKTGGWNHHGGMGMDPDYYRTGGAHDIAFLTATTLTALLLIQKCGIEVSKPVIDRAHENLCKLIVKGGIQYGTGNRSPDFGLCRVAAASIGLKLAGMTSSPILSAAAALPGAVAKTQDSHAFGPTNFLSAAIAMQGMGQYAAFSNHWLPKLAATQQADGTVRMLSDTNQDKEPNLAGSDRVSSSAVFCLMILMQKYKLIEPPKGDAPKSPFSHPKK